MIIDGAGGKGTWGKLLDTDCESFLDRNDPNYDSGEVIISLLLFILLLPRLISAMRFILESMFTALCNNFGHCDLNRSLMSLLDRLLPILWMITRKL